MATEKRLIDANALLQKIASTTGYVDAYTILSYITHAPTVDAVEVVHGRWIKPPRHKTHCKCSNCGRFPIRGMPNYCPNCGAKMDGDGNG